MKARFAFASLAALALASPAAAQQVAQINEAAGALGGGARATPAALPPVTQITPDTVPGRSLGTTVTPVGNRSFIDNGTRAGSNLFHSFAHFDLGQGDVAAWIRSAGDGAEIALVVNRVTGGDPSLIFGTIDSTALPNAGFWFINPAGILFGEGARLDVAGAARFSTAQELRFASGPAFTVATPGGSTFSVAAPRAFGFVGGQGSIALEGVDQDFVRPPGLLMLAARDVSMASSRFAVGDARLYAFGAGAGEIDFEDVHPTDFTGRVDIADSTLALAGIPDIQSGVRMVGRSIAITDSTVASLAAFDVGFGASILLQAADVRLDGSFVSTGTGGRADAGDLSIFGERIVVNGSFLTSEAGSGSSGTAGNIVIGGAESVLIEDGSFVTSATLSSRRGGDIRISAPQVDIAFSVVESGSSQDVGVAGDVEIAGGILSLREGSLVSSGTSGDGPAGTVLIDVTGRVDVDFSAISSSSTASFDPNATGDSGTVVIRTPVLTLASSSTVSSSTDGAGDAGVVSILADDISLAGGSTIASRTSATGDAGLVLIQGRSDAPSRMVLDTGGQIRSDTSGDGDAGGVFIDIDQIDILEGASIQSSASLPFDDPRRSEILGSAGAVFIRADRLTMSSPRGSDAVIGSESTGRGDAGLVQLDVGRLELEGQSLITTETSGTGAGGNIVIDADDVSLFNRALVSSSTNGSRDAGTIEIHATRSVAIDAGSQLQSFSRFGEGRGGTIRIDAPDIEVTRFGLIASTAFSSGDAGTIELRGGSLFIDSGGTITSSTLGDGAGGRVDIQMGEVTVAGGGGINADSFGACLGLDCFASGPAGDVFVRADRVSVIGADEEDGESRISSNTFTQDDAGNVIIEAGELLVDGGRIGSLTQNSGNAGSVSIDAHSVTLRNDAEISTAATRQSDCSICPVPSGNAGSIAIVAQDIDVFDGSLISSSTGGAGDAGTINIAASSLRLLDSGIITNTAPGSTGRSGLISIAAVTLDVIGFAGIETVSFNANEAGGILIDASRLLVAGPAARISSSNLFAVVGGSGDAGGIFISAGDIRLLDGAQLVTNSVKGAAGSIEIFMPETSILQLVGTDEAFSQITTSSGPGTGGRIFISNPLAIISNGGRILALGQQLGANVQIATSFFISSADRVNLVLVDGAFLLEAQVGDVSSGTVERDLSVVDASGVLRGQCAAVRATGQVSQLIVRPTGPYGTRPESGAEPPGSCF